jgi:hypothetical protein
MQLEALRRKKDYYGTDAPAWVHNVWPRASSFNWFVKEHSTTLVERGAIIKLGRDYFVNTEVFPAAARQILGVPDVLDFGGAA